MGALEELEQERKAQRIKDLKSDRAFREEYAPKIYNLIAFWLAVIILLLLLEGCSGIPFDIGDNILVTLIGGFSVSVVGLLTIVITYIFPQRSRRRKPKE